MGVKAKPSLTEDRQSVACISAFSPSRQSDRQSVASTGSETFRSLAEARKSRASFVLPSLDRTSGHSQHSQEVLDECIEELHHPVVQLLGRRTWHQQARTVPPKHAFSQEEIEFQRLGNQDLDPLLEGSDSESETPPGENFCKYRFSKHSQAASKGPPVDSSPDESVENELVDAFADVSRGSSVGSFGSAGSADMEKMPSLSWNVTRDLKAEVDAEEKAGMLTRRCSDLHPLTRSQIQDPGMCSGDLPDIFRCAAPILPRETDSPFSSQLPMPRRHAPCVVLSASTAHHEEGIRKLRHREFEQALLCMETAWAAMEQELSASATKDSVEFADPEVEPEEVSKDDPGANLVISSVVTLKRLAREQKVQKCRALKIMREQREEERRRLGKEHRLTRGLDLTLVYTRLKMWDKVDDFCGELLEIWGPPGTTPSFALSSEDETRWTQYMVRRAVACTCLGTKHLDRAESYYAEVLKVMPSHRDAKRGLRCVRFLGSQMLPAEAYSAMAESMSSM